MLPFPMPREAGANTKMLNRTHFKRIQLSRGGTKKRKQNKKFIQSVFDHYSQTYYGIRHFTCSCMAACGFVCPGFPDTEKYGHGRRGRILSHRF